MTEAAEVRETIARLLLEIKGNSFELTTIRADTDLLTEVGLDSLELTELILRLEDELEIEMDLNQFDWSSLRNLNIFVCFVLQAPKR